jgi:ribonuclease HI
MKISGYSDGACKRNPGPGGWGAVLYVLCPTNDALTYRFIDYGGKDHTTNQEMELMAFVKLLEICSGTDSGYILHTDSTYIVEALIGKGNKEGEIRSAKLRKTADFPGYITSWVAKGWKKADNGPVKHDGLWKQIIAGCNKIIAAGSTLEIKWVKGHAGNEGNELADQLANLGVPGYRL